MDVEEDNNLTAFDDDSGNNSSTFSNESSFCRVEQLVIYSEAAMSVFALLYVVIFACGIAGNLLVCLAVLRAKHLQTVTNFFIMNLAVSGNSIQREAFVN